MDSFFNVGHLVLDHNWERLVVGAADNSLDEVVACKETFAKMIALINILPERVTIPK